MAVEEISAQVPVQVVRVGGAQVAYRRKGSGETLVYFHGKGLTRRWLPLYEILADSFDVIVIDHPGYGDSERPRWFRRLDDLVVCEADVLDALGVETFHAVGHSFGALVGGSLAATYPSRIRSLTLIAPMPLPVVTPDELLPSFAGLPENFDFDSLLFNDDQEAYPQFRNGNDAGDLLANDEGDDPHADANSWDPRAAPGLYRRLGRIKAPRQVLAPDDDRVFPRPVSDIWAKWLDGARLVTISGESHPTGHLVIVQEPVKVAAAIVELAAPTESVRSGLAGS